MKQNIAVFFGGKSCEHDISIITANQVIKNLDEEKYEIFPIYVSLEGEFLYSKDYSNLNVFYDKNKAIKIGKSVILKNSEIFILKKSRIKSLCSNVVCLNCFHGGSGENGGFSGLMEMNDFAYTGSKLLSSAICMDKITTKQMLKEFSIPFVEYDYIFKDYDESKLFSIEKKLGYPLIVKPSNLGSSIGISSCENRRELIKALDLALMFDDRVLIERKLENFYDLNISVRRDEKNILCSQMEKPFSKDEILSFKDKYLLGGKSKTSGIGSGKRNFPYSINDDVDNEIKNYAKKVYDYFNLNGIVRIDFLIGKNNEVYLNEINTIPGSLAYYLWAKSFLDVEKILDDLIKEAKYNFEREKKKIKYFESSVLRKS